MSNASSASSASSATTASSAKLRILDVIHSVNPLFGGPSEGLRNFVAATRALGHEQQVLTLDAPGAPWVADFPAITHAVGPAHGGYGYTPRLLPWLRQHAHHYDAVIVHGLWQFHGLATRRALVGGRLPYFVFPHGMLDPWFKRQYPFKHAKKWLYWSAAEARVLRDAAAVLFTTQEESRLAPQSFPVYRARHAVLGFGLVLDAQAQAATAEDFLTRFPALRGKRLLLFLGRLHAKKGCDLLVQSFCSVAASDPSLHLVLAGPDADGVQAQLQQLAAHAGMSGRITCTGMLQGAAKWGALRAADVFVLPSHQENFGVAVVEALAMGLPTLLSEQVNIWRDVVAAGAGLAAPDTLAGTTALLQRWLSLPAASQAQMRGATVPCFERHFDMRVAAQRLVQLIRAQPADADPQANSQPCHTAHPQ